MHLSHDKDRKTNVALGKLCMFSISIQMLSLEKKTHIQSLSCVELEQTKKTDAAVFSLNESFFSLLGVLCAAEAVVVPRAFDKASCSSFAKSRTSPQGP